MILEKIKLQNNVYFIRMKKGNNYYWHYVNVAKNKEPLLKNIQAQEINIADFGDILESGWGVSPSEEIKQKYFHN
ncbi:MAG: hypothetical protein V4612_02520 [Pseudomonadota bacterium]